MQWIVHPRLRLIDFDQMFGLVDAYLSHSDLHTLLMLADRHYNPARSRAANACHFPEYASLSEAKPGLFPLGGLRHLLTSSQAFWGQAVVRPGLDVGLRLAE